MKKREAYDFTANPELTEFRFNSIGPKGVIPKIVEYTPYKNDLWNLAFGDVVGDDWTDNVVSDNDDMRKVLQTVANTAHLFLERYPDRKVYIEPLEWQRKILYNRLIKLKWEEIRDYFLLEGIYFREIEEEEEVEEYNPDNIYDAFVLSSKKGNFESKNFNQ